MKPNFLESMLFLSTLLERSGFYHFTGGGGGGLAGSKGNINFQNGHVTGVRKYKNTLNSLTNRIFSQVLGKLYNFKYVHTKSD